MNPLHSQPHSIPPCMEEETIQTSYLYYMCYILYYIYLVLNSNTILATTKLLWLVFPTHAAIGN